MKALIFLAFALTVPAANFMIGNVAPARRIIPASSRSASVSMRRPAS